MKLYYSPGACSIGIHVLLEEIGAPYEIRKLSLRDGEQYQPEFLQINPKSKVPTLVRDDGTVLTEFPAIATWLARVHPEKDLIPADAEGETRTLEAMDYVVGTIHAQGFMRIFRPEAFTPTEADQEKVRARGRKLFENGLALMDKTLDGKEWVAGRFSIADCALFYVEFWGADRLGMALPANLAAHYARMKARPSVQAVLRAEGLAS